MTHDELAALHTRCFRIPPPWPATAFATLLDSAGVFLITRPAGFILGRVAVDQAELLTLAVSPEHQRAGIGRDLACAFSTHAEALGAAAAFLEVASDNQPAQRLYRSLGWDEVGRRKHYYAAETDAIVMRLGLNPLQQGS